MSLSRAETETLGDTDRLIDKLKNPRKTSGIPFLPWRHFCRMKLCWVIEFPRMQRLILLLVLLSVTSLTGCESDATTEFKEANAESTDIKAHRCRQIGAYLDLLEQEVTTDDNAEMVAMLHELLIAEVVALPAGLVFEDSAKGFSGNVSLQDSFTESGPINLYYYASNNKDILTEHPKWKEFRQRINSWNRNAKSGAKPTFSPLE